MSAPCALLNYPSRSDCRVLIFHREASLLLVAALPVTLLGSREAVRVRGSRELVPGRTQAGLGAIGRDRADETAYGCCYSVNFAVRRSEGERRVAQGYRKQCIDRQEKRSRLDLDLDVRDASWRGSRLDALEWKVRPKRSGLSLTRRARDHSRGGVRSTGYLDETFREPVRTLNFKVWLHVIQRHTRTQAFICQSTRGARPSMI